MVLGHGGGGGLQEFLRGALGHGREVGENADFGSHAVFIHKRRKLFKFLPITCEGAPAGSQRHGVPAGNQCYGCSLGSASLRRTPKLATPLVGGSGLALVVVAAAVAVDFFF